MHPTGSPPEGVSNRPRGARWGFLGPIAVLAAITVALGLAAEPMVALSKRGADQLLDPSSYIEAVLGRSA